MIPILKFRLHDRIQLKKTHPCGGTVFRILRVGSEVRIVCETCGRDMTMDRIRLEKSVRQILESNPIQEETKKGTEQPHE